MQQIPPKTAVLLRKVPVLAAATPTDSAAHAWWIDPTLMAIREPMAHSVSNDIATLDALESMARAEGNAIDTLTLRMLVAAGERLVHALKEAPRITGRCAGVVRVRIGTRQYVVRSCLFTARAIGWYAMAIAGRHDVPLAVIADPGRRIHAYLEAAMAPHDVAPDVADGGSSGAIEDASRLMPGKGGVMFFDRQDTDDEATTLSLAFETCRSTARAARSTASTARWQLALDRIDVVARASARWFARVLDRLGNWIDKPPPQAAEDPWSDSTPGMQPGRLRCLSPTQEAAFEHDLIALLEHELDPSSHAAHAPLQDEQAHESFAEALPELAATPEVHAFVRRFEKRLTCCGPCGGDDLQAERASRIVHRSTLVPLLDLLQDQRIDFDPRLPPGRPEGIDAMTTSEFHITAAPDGAVDVRFDIAIGVRRILVDRCHGIDVDPARSSVRYQFALRMTREIDHAIRLVAPLRYTARVRANATA